MSLAAALIYWVIVALWLSVLGTMVILYIRNPRDFGTTRLLLAVLAIDTLRNIIENLYFGLYFGATYGFFSAGLVQTLGKPALLIIPKIMNVAAGCVVLVLLLHRWLPSAIRDRAKSEQAAENLKSLTSIDTLTGLYNRRQFELLSRAEWVRSQRYFQPISILIIDVDRFKDFGERFDHDTCDILLKRISASCAAAKRESDILARTDVHEFAMLLPHTDSAEARLIAEQARDSVGESRFLVGEETIRPTISIGIATSTLSMSGIEALIKRADGALHEARRAGWNRLATASASIDESGGVAAE